MSVTDPNETIGAARPCDDSEIGAERDARRDPRLAPSVENFLPVPDLDVLPGKFPVTVEEYQRFVDGRGYEERRLWDDGWAQKTEGGWEAPDSWDTQLRTPNRPVVGQPMPRNAFSISSPKGFTSARHWLLAATWK